MKYNSTFILYFIAILSESTYSFRCALFSRSMFSQKHLYFNSFQYRPILSVPKSHAGPSLNRSMLDVICDSTDLGVELGVGRSIIASGYGLYINAKNGKEVRLPRGTIICKYGKGRFSEIAEGDKTVTYGVYSLFEGVVFNNTLMPLFEVLHDISYKTKNLKQVFVGYTLDYNETSTDVTIQEDPSYINGRCFIPETIGDQKPSCNNLGVVIVWFNVTDFCMG